MNPIRQARLDQGLSLLDLVSMTGLSKNTILRTESGQVKQIPNQLLDSLNLDDSIQNAYEAWQNSKRAKAKLIPFTTLIHIMRAQSINLSSLNPLVLWIDYSGLSINAFCSMFCLPFSTIQDFCAHPEKYHSPPQDLIWALSDSLTPVGDVDLFLDAYLKFFADLNERANA